MRRNRMTHQFVENIPERVEDGTVYISTSHALAVHKCCCGCDNEVVTPLAPNEWSLNFDGETISLNPSIGNWSFPCESHYWIQRDQVRWARKWSRSEIAAARADEWLLASGQADNTTLGDSENRRTGQRVSKRLSRLWDKLRLPWRR